jgi:hypothetical protein
VKEASLNGVEIVVLVMAVIVGTYVRASVWVEMSFVLYSYAVRTSGSTVLTPWRSRYRKNSKRICCVWMWMWWVLRRGPKWIEGCSGPRNLGKRPKFGKAHKFGNGRIFCVLVPLRIGIFIVTCVETKKTSARVGLWLGRLGTLTLIRYRFGFQPDDHVMCESWRVFTWKGGGGRGN